MVTNEQTTLPTWLPATGTSSLYAEETKWQNGLAGSACHPQQGVLLPTLSKGCSMHKTCLNDDINRMPNNLAVYNPRLQQLQQTHALLSEPFEFVLLLPQRGLFNAC
jgi:hypothetical protein